MEEFVCRQNLYPKKYVHSCSYHTVILDIAEQSGQPCGSAGHGRAVKEMRGKGGAFGG